MEAEGRTVTEHRWSGWPGAWCFDCGIEDQTEICIGSHEHAEVNPETGACVVPCTNPPCPEPGSDRFNPYVKKETP